MSKFTDFAEQYEEEEWEPDEELTLMAQFCVALPWCSPAVYWELTLEERSAILWQLNRKESA